MKEKTIVSVLADVIEKHLPSTSRATQRGSAYTPQSEEHASGLITTLLTNAEVFGASHDIEALDDLFRSLINTQKQLKRISFPARQSINSLGSIWAQSSDYVLIDSFRESVENMAEAVDMARSARKNLKPASAKRNWEAAAIAGACRGIWGAEKFFATNDDTDDFLLNLNAFSIEISGISVERRQRLFAQRAEFTEMVKEFAPKAEKHDQPGPFGRFLEDVLSVLIVNGKNDETITAASALRSWRDASLQERQN